MRSILMTFVALFSFASAAGIQDLARKDMQVAVNSVFVPGGFDSESDVFVIVSGMFPNSC